MQQYNPQEIEKKWQDYWQKHKTFEVSEDKSKKKFYGLIEFPYPSGDGLHAGHLRSNTAMDIICRKRRMQGFNVLYPIGFDSFGLPAENYAVKVGVKPQISIAKNIETFTKQLKESGFSFDWHRSFSTTDSDYYRWTQWIFVQMFKHGLAEKKKETINWCTSCKIGLANEEVVNGVCERCGGQVVKKDKEQWLLKITKYADRLIDDLEKVDYLERIKTQQINWIGKSIGADVDFKISSSDEILRVFTTRPDTLFGVTFMVVAPEHSLISKFQDTISNFQNVKEYIEISKRKSELERTDLNKEKTGVELKGIKAINPVNNQEIPIFVADYVMMNYGTGAIMAVPAHDERDWQFAKKYNLEIIEVIAGGDVSKQAFTDIHSGKMVNSEFLNGQQPDQAIDKMISWLEEKKLGQKTTQYKLHDWIFSRQRYWGEPIPMVYCEQCANKKTTVLLIHGFTGNSQENWFPWFKKEMENKGIKIIIPDLPNTDNPQIGEWLESLDQLKSEFEGDLVIVGHSLGAFTACKFIEKNNFPVEKLILVAPSGKNCLNIDGLKKAGFEQDDIKILNNFQQETPDWKALSQLIKKTTIYLSENDPYVLLEKAKEEYKDLKSDYIILNKGHFNEDCGIRDFQEILKEFSDFENKGWQPIPEDQLPVELPDIDDFMPTEDGDSPLAKAESWIKTSCPKCGGEARRETDVMPNWAGSNWYFIRYTDPKNKQQLVDPDKAKYWLPVDWYNGGMEHTTLHLLYSRFVYKFLYDIGAVPAELGSEPYSKRTAHGMILGEGGVKMSKSKGNVINPDQVIAKYGADTVRLYEMFMGPFDQQIAWDDRGAAGIFRFLQRVWLLQAKLKSQNSKVKIESQNSKLITLLHQTIKKVGEDIEEMKFNTALSAMMILVNALEKEEIIEKETWEKFILILSPFAPHMAEELWQNLGHSESIQKEKWPQFDEALTYEDEVEIVVQINGRVRDKLLLPADIAEEQAKQQALKSVKVQKWLAGNNPQKVIYIKGKLVSIVV